MMICLAFSQTVYRAYSAFEALRWQPPDSSFREATRLSEGSHTIAKQSGIREDVQIVWANLYGEPAQSFGNNSYRSSALYILVDQDYVIRGDNAGLNNAMNVIMRHEYSHLRHDDFFKLKAVPAAASILSTVIGVSFLSPFATLALTTITGIAAKALYSRYSEARADEEAFSASTVRELEDFQQLLEWSKLNNIQLRQKNFLGRLCFSADGEDRRQIFSHPPLSQRIKAVSVAKSSC